MGRAGGCIRAYDESDYEWEGVKDMTLLFLGLIIVGAMAIVWRI